MNNPPPTPNNKMSKDSLKDDPIPDYEKIILIIKKVIYHFFYIFINKQDCSNVSLSWVQEQSNTRLGDLVLFTALFYTAPNLKSSLEFSWN